MASKINWSDKAQQDRKEIFKYWNTRNKSTEYSKKLNILIKYSVNYLKEFPTMGRESGYEGIRYLIVRDYLVFYKKLYRLNYHFKSLGWKERSRTTS